jgi:AAA domain-containing protein/bifunctional DNA primase/polymerase-like protein
MIILYEHAQWLHDLGANVNAIQRGTKKPLNRWEELKSRRQTAEELASYPWPRAGGVGIMNGSGGWHTFDIDAPKDAQHKPTCIVGDAAVDSLLDALRLPRDYAWVWRGESGAGWGLAFHCDDPMPPGTLPAKKDEAGVGWGWPGKDSGADWHHLELRYHACQTIYPPSERYRWRHDAPTAAPAVVPLHRVISAFFALCPPPPHTLGSIDAATKEAIRQRFDLVDYAVKAFGGDTQVEGREIRVLGHGGMLINPEKQVWNCFSDEVGGDCFELVAYAKYRTVAKNLNGKGAEILQATAEFAGVVIPDRVPVQPTASAPPAPHEADPVPWRIYRGAAIDQIIAPRQLIKGYLSIGTVALLIGPSEAGKSTIAVDMANKVAQHYGVLYVAGEDGGNVRSQIRAWELLHNKPRSPNLALVDGPVLLSDDVQVATFISAARTMAPRLIVIDTLSSCIPGVDENSSDVGHVTYNLNRISDELGASVLVLHHPLKYDGETFRGHSSLNNNTHTMLVVSRDEGDDTVSLKVIRHKGARAAPTTMRLVTRATDIVDPDDGVLSAPVALPANRVMLNDDYLSARQTAILQHLDDLDADGGATSSEIAREMALKYKTTEGVIRKDIASLVRRRLMSKGEKRNDPRIISTEGRKRIAVDHSDHTDHSAPNDPFVINARLDENTTIDAGMIFSGVSPVSFSDAVNTVNDPNDPQRSTNDPQVVDHLPDPSDMCDPCDPIFSIGSHGSFTEAGELVTEEQKVHTRTGADWIEELPADLPTLPLRRVAPVEPPIEVWDGDVPEDEELF